MISHLWGLRAHLAATGRDAPAVNLKFLIEGEEETGSAHLGEIAPVLFFGTGLPEDLWHDSDERADLDTLRRGAVTLALLWPRLAGTDLGRH